MHPMMNETKTGRKERLRKKKRREKEIAWKIAACF
jgi:hypothetical protein